MVDRNALSLGKSSCRTTERSPGGSPWLPPSWANILILTSLLLNHWAQRAMRNTIRRPCSRLQWKPCIPSLVSGVPWLRRNAERGGPYGSLDFHSIRNFGGGKHPEVFWSFPRFHWACPVCLSFRDRSCRSMLSDENPDQNPFPEEKTDRIDGPSHPSSSRSFGLR